MFIDVPKVIPNSKVNHVEWGNIGGLIGRLVLIRLNRITSDSKAEDCTRISMGFSSLKKFFYKE